MKAENEPWLTGTQVGSADARLRLWCLPHAGVGASVYRPWIGCVSGVAVAGVALPGREGRLRERAFTEIGALADAAAAGLAEKVDRPYALFGHSMGALLAFELARRFRDAGLGEPVHLFVSGRRAPHLPSRRPALTHLPDEAFVEAIARRYGGVPREVREHPDLLALLLPTLRADFRAVESYAVTAAPPLTCPVTALGGTRDEETTAEELEGWSEHTTGGFRVRRFEGGHFFVQEAGAEVLAYVTGVLGEGVAYAGGRA